VGACGGRAVIAVTGATGGLGGRVARELAARGVPQRLVVRDAARAPALAGAEVAAVAGGYADRAGMAAALRGAETMLLVSAHESPDRVAEHRSAIDAAADAGVRRVVYTSFLAAAADATFTLGRHHFATEQHVRARGLEFTFLRDSLYLDVVPRFAGADGVIRGPAGDGRCGFVARDDCADVAVVALTEPGHAGATYDLTGPEAMSYADAAAVVAEVTGRPVRFVDETLEEAWASRRRYGAPDHEVEGWITSYTTVAAGDLDVVTDVVPRLTGRPARTLRDVLTEHPEGWAHLRG
jgi:uncharacterized protein YbjT (DUF2867 family)